MHFWDIKLTYWVRVKLRCAIFTLSQWIECKNIVGKSLLSHASTPRVSAKNGNLNPPMPLFDCCRKTDK